MKVASRLVQVAALGLFAFGFGSYLFFGATFVLGDRFDEGSIAVSAYAVAFLTTLPVGRSSSHAARTWGRLRSAFIGAVAGFVVLAPAAYLVLATGLGTLVPMGQDGVALIAGTGICGAFASVAGAGYGLALSRLTAPAAGEMTTRK